MFPVNDLVRIAAAGGGLDLRNSTMPVNDLVRIAAAASNKKATIRLRGAGRPVNDLVRIAAAGQGAVIFSFD